MDRKLKRILIIMVFVLITAIALFSLGIAYAGGIRGIGLIGIWFFLTFGIIVVLAQLIPAGILLSSFIGTSFSSSRRNEMPIRAT
ncbi:MAG: hypothetical protein KG012_18890 [Deltaproteobacteria bacterium]|nr:hypothetical protein [Deltaproteobacteria bacterium]